MRRLPILPTILVAAAVAAMIGLGLWQLQRAQWKERVLAEYAAAASMPALDLDPLLERDASQLPPLSFRRVLVTCRARDSVPQLRGGRSVSGQGGYSYFIPCRPGASGLAGRLSLNAGWSAMPDDDLRLSFDGIAAGRLGMVGDEGRIVLTSARGLPPLEASTAPRIEDIANNHLAYAIQWFFFAATAAIIYVLAVRRRGRDTLPPGA